MKVLHVSEATGLTGGTNQILLTSRELVRRGHEVALACPPEGELAAQAREAGIEVAGLPVRKDYDLASAWRLGRMIAERRVEVLHAHHPRAHAIGLLALLLSGIAVRFVVTRRVIFPVGRNLFSRWKYRARRVDRYVAVCAAVAQELQKAGVGPERIATIPSGVDFARFDAARAARAALPPGPPWSVGMVGHYATFKGHEFFLRAAREVAARLPQTRFWVVGRGTHTLSPLASELGIAGRVEFLGERRDVPDLLARTHLFVMPSLMEGIGTALVEAQAAGVPVVASRVGGLPDVVEDGVTGRLVPPGDAAALAAAMTLSLERPADAAAMAERGYARVRDAFSLPGVVSRIEAVYGGDAA